MNSWARGGEIHEAVSDVVGPCGMWGLWARNRQRVWKSLESELSHNRHLQARSRGARRPRETFSAASGLRLAGLAHDLERA